ncbi:MAG: MOSC domain-containing protein [Lachnospiraceae bacterium]
MENRIGVVTDIRAVTEKGKGADSLICGEFLQGFGLKGDIHSGAGIRQVSILSRESRLQIEDLGSAGYCTQKFSENITTEGILLFDRTVGTRIRIGETIQEISQIGKSCYADCPLGKSSELCILSRECIFTKVITGGKISPGDPVSILKEGL